MTKRSRNEPLNLVILDHDGGVDDLVALALLLTQPENVRVVGCVVTDADCYVDHAHSVSGKLASMMYHKSGKSFQPFPIAKSSLKGIHPFPHDWRVDAKKMDDLPCLNVPQYAKAWKEDFLSEKLGEELLAELVMNSTQLVSICVTGPLSNVAHCIEKYGKKFTDNVKEVVIMGGAVDVGGNVFVDGCDKSAEWNIYWDAKSAKTVLESPLLEGKNKLFSLDATNHVPVTSEYVQTFGSILPNLLANFIGSSWAQCTHLSLLGAGHEYYAWDVLTAAYIIDNSLASLQRVAIEVVAEVGSPSEGQTKRSEQGTNVLVATNIDSSKFYKMVFHAAQFV